MSSPFSPLILEHFRRPRNAGALEAPDAVREGANPLCGDRVRFELAVGDGGRVSAVRFRGDACAIAVASASLLGERVAAGMALADVERLTLDDVLAMLEAPVGEARRACARLPLDVLRAAARDCLTTPPGAVAAVLLAAGASTRFGAQKLLAPLADGRAVVRHAAEGVLAGTRARELVVVVGREGDAVSAALDGLPVRVVPNPRYADGMGGSLRTGIAALPDGTRAALVALGDQPFVPPGVMPRLLAAYRAGAAPIIAPGYRGTRGNPVVFDAAIFPELLAVAGDEGARGIIARDPARVRVVELALDMPADVDEPADLERLTRPE